MDPNTGLPPRVEVPKTDWFDPDKSAKPDAATDSLIEIYEGRFVGVIYNTKHEPTIFGDLRNEGTSFVAWFPLHRRPQFSSATEQIAKALLPYRLVDFVAEWENPLKWTKELKLLDYKFEKHETDNDPLRLTADAHDPAGSRSLPPRSVDQHAVAGQGSGTSHGLLTADCALDPALRSITTPATAALDRRPGRPGPRSLPPRRPNEAPRWPAASVFMRLCILKPPMVATENQVAKLAT